MLSQLFFQILDWIASGFTMILLGRVLMQWARVPFFNPLGQFVMAASDWLVIPARRLIPSARGLDSASLLLAWLTQLLYQLLLSVGLGAAAGMGGLLLASLPLLALFAVIKSAIYLLMGIVIISALMSWINPHAPLAPVLFQLSRPFLAPLQRLIPPLGGVDLSPIVLLLVLQILLTLLTSVQYALLPGRL